MYEIMAGIFSTGYYFNHLPAIAMYSGIVLSIIMGGAQILWPRKENHKSNFIPISETLNILDERIDLTLEPYWEKGQVSREDVRVKKLIIYIKENGLRLYGYISLQKERVSKEERRIIPLEEIPEVIIPSRYTWDEEYNILLTGEYRYIEVRVKEDELLEIIDREEALIKEAEESRKKHKETMNKLGIKVFESDW